MIKYIKRANLDIAKYNTCIDSAHNSRIYAYSWYLDIIATNWDALVLDDYKAVMPLTWRQKYFIKYIYNPCWTQQLGVFSTDSIDETLVKEFIKTIPRKFKKVSIQFNSDNPINGKGVTKKVNYILPLDKSYEELHKGYKYVRRRKIKKLIGDSIKIELLGEISEIVQLHKNHKRFTIDKNNFPDYSVLNELANCLYQKKEIDIVVARNGANEILGGALFLKDQNRITYLLSAISDLGRESQVMAIVIDAVIKKYSKTKYILDFEGSMISGVAFFFRSFGSKEEVFYFYQKK